MAVVTLIFVGSDEEIVDGIPRYMTIESNVPSTIHFTLDGTTPNINSPIYTGTFEMPDGRNSVTLSAFGIDADSHVGPVLTQVFAPDTTRISVTRLVGLEGWYVDRFMDLNDFEDGFGVDGQGAIRVIDKPLYELNPIYSERGRLGIDEGARLNVEKYPPELTAYPFDDDFVAYSTPENAQFFNPLAKVIVNDERVNNDIRIINRPWGSIRKLHRNDWGKRELGGTDSTYISGGFVRRFYNTRNRIMVSYYFDQNESRYVKGIQELPQNIPNTMGFNTPTAQPLVFRWIERGRHSSIPL